MPQGATPLQPLLRDVQTGVLRAIKAQLAAYLFFRITDRQAFIAQLPDKPDSTGGLGLPSTLFHSEAWRVENRRHPGCDDVVSFANIAFTFNGLRAVGVVEETLETFPEAFREGMAHRAALLGDTGPTAPERWDGYLGSGEVHGVAWVSFHFPAAPATADVVRLYEELHAAVSELSAAGVPAIPVWPPAARGSNANRPALGLAPAAIRGAEILHVELGLANYAAGADGELGFPVEHFGFRDGISQPFADIGLPPPPPGGGTPRPGDSWEPLARGELLLGYPDEQDNIQRLPANKELRNNGTYMVFRKLEQDVVSFRNFVRQHDSNGTPGKLAAQMVGRWPDGTPLVQHPDGPQAAQTAPSRQTVNDFRYQATDPQGLRCPIGAHIRRANPRDTNGRDEARRHRLFRRGISYGGLLLEPDSAGDGNRRGMLFVSMQARIDRQFEIVQSHWLGRGELSGQAGAHADPLVGAHDGRVHDAFQPTDRPGPVTGLPRFVTLRGGDYFFVPSFTALALMKAGARFERNDDQSPIPEDALGSVLPARSDNSAELVEMGKALLESPAPFAPLPPLTKAPYPGAPSVTFPRIIVGRHRHVKAVLQDDVHFSNAPFDETSRAILGGQQLLIGLPKGPERDKRLAVLHDALRAMGGPLPVEDHAKRLVNQVLDRVGPLGRLDVVGDFGRVVPILAAEQLFGVKGPAFVSPTAIAARFARYDVTDMPDDWLRTVPPVDDHAKPLITMQAWTRMTFLQIFVNMPAAKELIAPAERAAREFMRQIDDLLFDARMNPGTGKPGNLLEALARLPVDLTDGPDPYRHARLLLAEFTAGAVETLNAALTHAVEYVLDNKSVVLQALRDHLREPTLGLDELIGKLSDRDLDILIYEILRFDPMGALAFRTCVTPGATIGGQPVAPGTIVCLVAAAAMLDKTVFLSPAEIRFDRPAGDYLHFGTGMHACMGQTISTPFVFPIAMPLLREMFRAIMTRPRLRRAAGKAGERRHTYPLLVDGLTVRFEPTAGRWQ